MSKSLSLSTNDSVQVKEYWNRFLTTTNELYGTIQEIQVQIDAGRYASPSAAGNDAYHDNDVGNAGSFAGGNRQSQPSPPDRTIPLSHGDSMMYTGMTGKDRGNRQKMRAHQCRRCLRRISRILSALPQLLDALNGLNLGPAPACSHRDYRLGLSSLSEAVATILVYFPVHFTGEQTVFTSVEDAAELKAFCDPIILSTAQLYVSYIKKPSNREDYGDSTIPVRLDALSLDNLLLLLRTILDCDRPYDPTNAPVAESEVLRSLVDVALATWSLTTSNTTFNTGGSLLTWLPVLRVFVASSSSPLKETTSWDENGIADASHEERTKYRLLTCQIIEHITKSWKDDTGNRSLKEWVMYNCCPNDDEAQATATTSSIDLSSLRGAFEELEEVLEEYVRLLHNYAEDALDGAAIVANHVEVGVCSQEEHTAAKWAIQDALRQANIAVRTTASSVWFEPCLGKADSIQSLAILWKETAHAFVGSSLLETDTVYSKDFHSVFAQTANVAAEGILQINQDDMHEVQTATICTTLMRLLAYPNFLAHGTAFLSFLEKQVHEEKNREVKQAIMFSVLTLNSRGGRDENTQTLSRHLADIVQTAIDSNHQSQVLDDPWDRFFVHQLS